MKTLTGNNVYLRALEPTDLEFLYALENDESVWEVSNTTTPYSKYVLQQYLENAHRDIYEIKQLRMVICDATTERPVGFIDLFNFEPKHRRVGVGVIIFSEDDRGKGFAGEALSLIRNYAVIHLKVHQLHAAISEDNERSIHLFKKQGYEQCGVKKDWTLSEDGFKDELLFQLIVPL